jgi:hypothetical protein
MIHVQHGIMLVGDPMSCKTKLYEVLADTLTRMSEQKGLKHQGPIFSVLKNNFAETIWRKNRCLYTKHCLSQHCFEINTPIGFEENYQNLPKTVIMTLTPDDDMLLNQGSQPCFAINFGHSTYL